MQKTGIKVGNITEEEKKEIRDMQEMINSLQELIMVFDNNFVENKENFEIIYNKLVKDYKDTKERMSEWWDCNANKYKWEKRDDGYWIIDFRTNDIILMTKNN